MAKPRCTECGGTGGGPDRIDGPGDVYQGKCDRCGGTGAEPTQSATWQAGASWPRAGDVFEYNGERTTLVVWSDLQVGAYQVYGAVGLTHNFPPQTPGAFSLIRVWRNGLIVWSAE